MRKDTFTSLKKCIFASNSDDMSNEIEKAMTGGIVFKGKASENKEEKKVKTKAKKTTYIKGTHGSASAKKKAEIRKKRASRSKR